jgi:hypothetical protein
LADRKQDRLEIQAGEVVAYGENANVGIVEEIRVVDTAALVKRFSGGPGEVMLRIRTLGGTAMVWPGRHAVSKLGGHDAKAFRAKLGLPEISEP